MNGPLSSTQVAEMLAKAKAEGWEIREHLKSGAVQMRHPNIPMSGIPRSTRRLLDALWRQSVVIFDPTTAKLA